MMEQGIHQGSLLMACADMDNHSGGFIDYQQIGILMENLQGNVLGAGPGGEFRRLFLDPKMVS